MRSFHSKLLPLAVNDSRIVTPDTLRASMLAERHAAAQIAQNASGWEQPVIQSIDVWLTSCWQDMRYSNVDAPVLLSPWQETLVWREVIEAGDFDLGNVDLLDTEATAQIARRAAATVSEWHIPLNAVQWRENADAQRFREWYESFKHLCSRRNFITKADLWTLVPEWIANGNYRPNRTAFWGFDVQSPAFQKLVSALGNLATIVESDPGGQLEVAEITVCEDLEQELEYAGRWARAVFEEDSTQTAAVFVPDLATHRALVERSFKRVFYPSAALRLEDRNGRPSMFHIAAPSAVDEHPVVASALLLLELGKRQIMLADAGAILRSPFTTGAVAERSERAQADLLLREERELEVSLREMQRASKNCPQLTHAFEAVVHLNTECPAHQDLPSWSGFIGDLLQAVGWPGDVSLTDAEEQIVDCWNSALSTLGTLSMVSGPVSYSVALAHLGRILSASGVEIGDWSSPIQVLDTRTAAGLNFDRAFAVGLSEELWPSTQRAPSLIPLQLQRACNAPCCSPQSIQEEHARVASALFSSAATVAGTYSGGRLSPFAEPYVRESFSKLPHWAGKLPRQSFGTATLEERADDFAPMYRTSREARGGTGIIKSQSLCPFRAFAEYRLNAAFPDDACFGFDNLQRGGFLHKALEFVWQPLRTQERLLSLSGAELRAGVDEAVAKAIALAGDSQFQHEVTVVERKRVGELVFDWLTGVESTRTQPFAVEKIEGERIFELGGLRLRLRIDRIDRLPNGRLLLIDYKSGEPSRKSLEGDRPGEPQLLVYAAAMGGEVDGIFFGQLKPRNLKAVGYSHERQFHGKAMGVLGEKWDAFLETSQENVERLAREFVGGHTAVNPVKGACDYCHISPLCRIQELSCPKSELGEGDSE